MDALQKWMLQFRAVEGAVGTAEVVENGDVPSLFGVQSSKVST
jgi:hypothetical protein